MIITSNDITHNCNIVSLSIIGQVDDNIDVVYQAKVSVQSSLEFEYTKEVYQYANIQEQTGLTTSIVTVNDSVIQTKEYDVSFNTIGIETFSSYNTLTENQVMNWCIAANFIDDVDADILETVKVGDDLTLTSDIEKYQQEERAVILVDSTSSVITNAYSENGVSEDPKLRRPVIWCKQTEDRIIDGKEVGKDRVLYEALINPVATNNVSSNGESS